MCLAGLQLTARHFVPGQWAGNLGTWELQSRPTKGGGKLQSKWPLSNQPRCDFCYVENYVLYMLYYVCFFPPCILFFKILPLFFKPWKAAPWNSCDLLVCWVHGKFAFGLGLHFGTRPIVMAHRVFDFLVLMISYRNFGNDKNKTKCLGLIFSIIESEPTLGIWWKMFVFFVGCTEDFLLFFYRLPWNTILCPFVPMLIGSHVTLNPTFSGHFAKARSPVSRDLPIWVLKKTIIISGSHMFPSLLPL